MLEIDECMNNSMISNNSSVYIKPINKPKTSNSTKLIKEVQAITENSQIKKDINYNYVNLKDDYFTQNLQQKRVLSSNTRSKSKEKIKLNSIDTDREFIKFNKIMNEYIDENKDSFKYEERKDNY